MVSSILCNKKEASSFGQTSSTVRVIDATAATEENNRTKGVGLRNSYTALSNIIHRESYARQLFNWILPVGKTSFEAELLLLCEQLGLKLQLGFFLVFPFTLHVRVPLTILALGGSNILLKGWIDHKRLLTSCEIM